MKKHTQTIRLRRLSNKSLERTQWAPDFILEHTALEKKKPGNDLRLAVLVGNRLYAGLRYESDLLLLQEDTWASVLHYGRPDLVLVESCFESCTGHWKESLIVENEAHGLLRHLLKTAQELRIPTVFWQTMDKLYDDVFAHFLSYFDLVCFSDPRSFRMHDAKSLNSIYLPPAIQPILHHPYRRLPKNNYHANSVVYDGWGDLHRLGPHDAHEVLQRLKKYGLSIIDSRYYLWKKKAENLMALKGSLHGCLDPQTLPDFLRSRKIGITFEPSTITRTEQQWWSFEAVGCGAAVIHFGDFIEKDVRSGILDQFTDDDNGLQHVADLQNNELLRCLKVREARRQLGREHTYANRLDSIFSSLNLADPLKPSADSISCLTVIRFQHEFDAVLETYQKQTLRGRELVVACIGNQAGSISENKKVPDLKLMRMPDADADRAYQAAARRATGDYCIHLGPGCREPNYLEDMSVNLKSRTADILLMLPPIYLSDDFKKRGLSQTNSVDDSADYLQYSINQNLIFPSGSAAGIQKVSDSGQMSNAPYCISTPTNLGHIKEPSEYTRLISNDDKRGRPPVREKLIAGMASIPIRAAILPQVLENLIPQFDHIFVYLNGHEKIPDCVKQEKVSYAWSKDHGDLAASGKFFFLEEARGGYYFTVDDDFLYPPNYAYRMVAALKKYKDQAAVCVHGSIFGEPLEWFFERNAVFASRDALFRDQFVTLIGTATAAFHTESIKLCFDDFFPRVMCDLQFSIKARSQEMPIVSIARPRYWVQTVKDDPQEINETDYWTKMLIDDEGRTELAQSYNWDFFEYAPLVLKTIDRIYPGIDCSELEKYKFDVEFISGARSSTLPASWSSENSGNFLVRKYQFLRKDLKMLKYRLKHGNHPEPKDIFTKDAILKNDFRNLTELKGAIKVLQKQIAQLKADARMQGGG